MWRGCLGERKVHSEVSDLLPSLDPVSRHKLIWAIAYELEMEKHGEGNWNKLHNDKQARTVRLGLDLWESLILVVHVGKVCDASLT